MRQLRNKRFKILESTTTALLS